MNTYKIVVKDTGEELRVFYGDVYLDECLSTWRRVIGKEIIAVLVKG